MSKRRGRQYASEKFVFKIGDVFNDEAKFADMARKEKGWLVLDAIDQPLKQARPLDPTWCEQYLLRADPTFDILLHRELFLLWVPRHLTRREKEGAYEQFCNDRFWQLMRDKQG